MDSHLRGNDDFVGMRGNDAEGAKVTQRAQKGIPKLFENALNQCLCGLQGINGLQAAWELVMVVLPCASVVLAVVPQLVPLNVDLTQGGQTSPSVILAQAVMTSLCIFMRIWNKPAFS